MIGGRPLSLPGRRAKMLPIPSIATPQPASLHQRMKRSRASPSSLERASRRTPPFSVAPILARSIRDFHNRCESIDISAIPEHLVRTALCDCEERRKMRKVSLLQRAGHRFALVRRPRGIVGMGCPASVTLDCSTRPWIDSPDCEFLQGDAIHHRADVNAQVAAYALLVDDLEMTLAVLLVADGLMRRVLAGDIAAAALDAQILVDVRLDRIVQVQVFPVDEVGHGLASEVGECLVSLLVHPVVQA